MYVLFKFFAQIDRLFDCRFLLEGIGWQVAQFGVQPLAVVKTDDAVCNVVRGLGVAGVVLLPNAQPLEAVSVPRRANWE